MKFVLLITLILFSCSKDEVIDQMALWDRIREVEPTAQIVLPKSVAEEVVKCSDYPPGCAYGGKIKIKNVDIIVVQYKSSKLALKAARILKIHRYKNWLFDDVIGEPILEQFVKKAFNAEIESLPAK